MTFLLFFAQSTTGIMRKKGFTMNGKDPRILQNHPFAALLLVCAGSVYMSHRAVKTLEKNIERARRVQRENRRWMKKFQP